MKLRTLLAGAAVLLSASSALAEPLAGRVLDSNTLQPIAGAEVRTSSGKKTKTNAEGYFQFGDVPRGRVTVRVKAPGYELGEERIRIPEGGLLDQSLILFKPDAAGEVVKIKGRKKPPKPEAPGKQVLQREEITRIPGTRGDALQSIRSLPGVANAVAQGSGPGQIVIRGSAPEDSKITIDGIQVPLLYHFFGFQSIIPSEFIDSIEYLPGGFGAHDGNATGGVINVKTRGADAKETKGFAELSFVNLAGFLQGPISKKHHLSFTAAGRRSLIDYVLPAVVPSDANLSFTAAPIYYDGQLRVDWKPKYSDRVSLFVFGSSDELSLVNDNVNPNEPQATGNFDNSTSFVRPILSWVHETDELESRVVGSMGVGGFKVGVGPDRFFKVASKTGQLRSDIAWSPDKLVTFKGGAEHLYRQGDLDTKLPLPPAEGSGGVFNFSSQPVVEFNDTVTNNVSGGYLSSELHPTQRTTISPGIRLDYYHRFNAATWGPRLSVQHKISDDILGTFAMGAYSRSAEQAEAFTTTLRPETATQYVLGGEYRINQGLTFTNSLFYTDREGLIGQDPLLAKMDPQNSYINIGRGRSFGNEAVLRAQTRDFFGWITYTLSRSDRVDTPLGDTRLFDYDQTHNLVAVASYKWKKWQFGGRFQYSTGQPLTPIEGATYVSDLNIYLPTVGEINTDRYDSPHQLDLRVDRKWKFDSWDLEAFLDVTNVYGHAKVIAYRYNFDYTQQEAVTELPFVPALGARGSF